MQPDIIRGQDLLLRLVVLEDEMDEDEEGLVLAAADMNKRSLERELNHWVSQQAVIKDFLDKDRRRLEEELRNAPGE